MNYFSAQLLSLLILLFFSGCNKTTLIDLSGEWRFQADPNDKGVSGKWYANQLTDFIHLPGSMTTKGKGNEITADTRWTGQIVDSSWFKDPKYEKYRQPGNIKVPFWLQPDKYYVGAAWYQKVVTIPQGWRGSNIQLFLERCHWETRVWVDEREAGMRNSLGTPHVYDLSEYLTPGKHTLTICVDNRIKEINVGQNSHSVSDHTQSNWNGLVGRLELQARSSSYISDVKVFPDISKKQVKVKVSLKNIRGGNVTGSLHLKAEPLSGNQTDLQPLVRKISVDGTFGEAEFEYPMGSAPLLWDEFHPNLYKIEVVWANASGEKDQKEITFGMREFKTSGTRFIINGRPVFLRGTLECAIFPKTGYPPTDTASWGRIFRIAKAHGLNHFRFHSWCPPAAAFEAADRAGFYLHVECSSWANQGASIGDGKPIDTYLYEESERMVNAYGNHPSFCIMLYGNEPAGRNQNKWLGEFDMYWKNKDPRRLYSGGAGWPDIPESDFYSTSNPRIQGWGQGLGSIINAQAPKTDYDWRDKVPATDKPTVSHEIGQWCVYPDFKEIPQYNGVLKARNFEIFKETLEENQLSSLADSFVLASGKLQALCYKADIEAALRTPGFGGFQLLDLHDFPGQGTALVGVLNPFWEEKGYITAKEYSRFCNATVPLIRLPKMIYTSGEKLIAKVEVANFGEMELQQISPRWKVTDESGGICKQGTLPVSDIPWGNGISLGEIKLPLAFVDKASMLTLTVSVDEHENSWNIWVYPESLPDMKTDMLITQQLDANALETLESGGKVLLSLKKGTVKPEFGGNVALGFSSIFWNTAWTKGQAPHTLGILCNPKHPALAEFPTEYHSNWQWWDALSHGNAVNLSALPENLCPIVRIIDDWFTNRPLGLIFEVKAGNGKLLICAADLLANSESRPEARQLLYSLKKYMMGLQFNPSVPVNMETLKTMFK